MIAERHRGLAKGGLEPKRRGAIVRAVVGDDPDSLFFPHNLDLSEAEADKQCGLLIDHVRSSGGVLTVLWHDRSHGPERFWGDFYIGLVRTLKSLDPWFGTASQIVGWFRQRRDVRFGAGEAAANGAATSLLYTGGAIEPPLRIRLHHFAGCRIGGTRRASDRLPVGRHPQRAVPERDPAGVG